MAEGLLSHLAGGLIESLASSAIQEIALAWGCKREINKLSRTASYITAGLRVAEEQHNFNNDQVTLWLEDLKDVLIDVEDLLADFSTEALRKNLMTGNVMVKEVRLFFSKSNKLVYAHKMGRRVKAIRQRLAAILDDRAKFQCSDHPVEPPIELKEREQTHSFVPTDQIIGRDDDKKKIVEVLLESNPEQNVSVVPIVGIGGLGKTTLAGMVFDDEQVREHFELKMWVTVSEKFELNVIVEKLIEAATGNKPGKGLQMQTLKDRLQEKINGKKFLLVLDDVWNDDNERWHKLKSLLLAGSRGSWIVLTTRDGRVADISGTISAHVLEGLTETESWYLLKQVAFKEQRQEYISSHFEAVGMEIVEKCKGVPLALRAIGSLLFEKSKAEWSMVRYNVLQYMTQQENGILPTLKLSYNHLSPHLKQCFAYCSIFPKNIEIEVEELIMHWMAQGFIRPLSANEDLEDVGQEYFNNLLCKCFFQVYEKDDEGNVKRVTMHDLMHDLARSVAGFECCIASSEAENFDERTLHVAFDRLDSSWKIPRSLLRAKRARSIQISIYRCLNPSTRIALISSFQYLRMLNLTTLSIKRLPHSIGNLKHLKSLDLSGSYFIRELPNSFCRLQNLQILKLVKCDKLEKLPSKTSRLVSLRHLYIDGCDNLAYMPRALERLTCLRTLTNFIVGKPGREIGQFRELNGLNKLQGQLYISGLENAIPESGCTCLKEKLNLKSLKLRWNRGYRAEVDEVTSVNDEMVLAGLQPHPNLEKLEVNKYSGSKFSSWLSSITSLTKLSLLGCHKCKHLPPLHQLSSLKFLRLCRLEALEHVSDIEVQNELSCAESTTMFLPSLEELYLDYCPNLRGWWRGNDAGDHASNALLPYFSNCLSNLYIIGCPNLNSMPRFPSVRMLRLEKTSWKLVQQTMKLTTSGLAPSSSSSSSSPSLLPPFSKLHTMDLKAIEDLDSLPQEFLQNLTSLEYLQFEDSIKLKSEGPTSKMLTVYGRSLNKISSCLSSITSLTELRLNHCDKCKHLPPLHQLSSLKSLELRELKALEHVTEIDMQNELSSARSTTIFLPSLETLQIYDCPNLKGWWKGTDVGGDQASNVQLPCFSNCLSYLNIEGCPKLTSMPRFPSVKELYLKRTSWKPVQQTMKLTSGLAPPPPPPPPSSSSSSSSSLLPPFSILHTMYLTEIEDLDSLPHELLQNLTSFQYLRIIECMNLTSMPEGIPLLTNLTGLTLESYDKCKHLPPLHQLTSLKSLSLSGLKALEHVSDIEIQNELSSAESTTIFFPSLEKLYLINCPNLKGWWRDTDVGDQASNAHLPCFSNCLSDLIIKTCPNLTSIPGFPSVKRLTLEKTRWKLVQQTMKLTTSGSAPSSSSSSPIPHFSKLNRLELRFTDLDSLPQEFLQNLTSLQSLFILCCLELTSMPEGMRLLTSLKRLEICFCPHLSERCKRH